MTAKTLQRYLDGPKLFELEVVGESHFQKNLQAILERSASAGTSDRVAHRVTAKIVSEPTNPHDPNAVQVFLDDLLVGYIDRVTAARIRKQLDRAGYNGIDATCSAMIVGGFNLEIGNVLYGVKLDIYTKSQRSGEANPVAPTELTFFVETIEPILNESLAFVGNVVNFWSSPNMPSRINVYCCGGISGEGKLGTVPKEAIIPIQRHLSAGSEFDAKIVSKSDRLWEIQCRLIPAEETKQRIEEYARVRREKLQKDLTTPYRPRKPINFIICAKRNDLAKGDVIEIVELPNLDQMFTEYGPQNVLFRCVSSGKEIEHRCDNGLVQKLIRLRIGNNPVTGKVTAKSRARQETIDFTIEIPPLAQD